MIDEKKIEEAAEKASVNYSIGRYEDLDFQEGFKAGINWLLDNLWHDASEVPKQDKDICMEMVGYEQNKFYGVICSNQIASKDWDEFQKDSKLTRWLYIEGLMKGGK